MYLHFHIFLSKNQFTNCCDGESRPWQVEAVANMIAEGWVCQKLFFVAILVGVEIELKELTKWMGTKRRIQGLNRNVRHNRGKI